MHEIHGPLEWTSLPDMEKATELCVELVRLWSEAAGAPTDAGQSASCGAGSESSVALVSWVRLNGQCWSAGFDRGMIEPMGQEMSKPRKLPAAVSAPAAVRTKALQLLRAREPELRAKGVIGVALFGSTARGDAGAASDVDLVIELDDTAALGMFDLVELKDSLAQELGRPVDIAFRSRLRPWFADRIASDLVRVF